MKAILIDTYGDADVLHPGSAQDPVANAGEVVVRVAATSINPIDIMRRAGLTKDESPLHFPTILGYDLAGTIVALGEGVTDFSVGDDVFGMADQTYAELCVTPASSLALIPKGMTAIEVAALPVVTITGNMLAHATGVTAGQTVLVTGAAGNVGRSAVYTLKQLGAHVIAAVLKSQVADAASLGADQVIATDVPEEMSNLQILDAVADAVAGKTAETLIAKVKPGGTFASVLGAPANAANFPAIQVKSVYAVPNPKPMLLMALAVQSGALVIPIGKQMPLAEAAEAHKEIADRAVKGKVVLVVTPVDQARTEAEAEIRVLLQTYNAALNGSDTSAVLPLYTQDGIFMAPFGPSAIGQAAIRKAYDHVFTMLKFNVVFTVLELVVLTSDYAYGRTGSAGQTTNPQTGKQSSEGNQELFVFRKDADARWKIARYSFSPIAPPKA